MPLGIDPRFTAIVFPCRKWALSVRRMGRHYDLDPFGRVSRLNDPSA